MPYLPKTRSLGKLLTVSLLMGLLSFSCVRGPKGAAGTPGTPGKDASLDQNSGIVATLNCEGEIFGLTGYHSQTLNGLFVTYDAVLTQPGDVYATANVADEAFQVSGTAFYASGQNGANTATVFITDDHHGTADGGFWEISLDRKTLITTAIYTDSGMGAESPVTIKFTADACEARKW